MKEKRYTNRPKTVYLWQELNSSLQAISNFSWFMTGVNVPSPVTLNEQLKMHKGEDLDCKVLSVTMRHLN